MKIARWREKYDQIPEDTKDPGLMKAKKALKKKMPTRRSTEQYWNEAQFDKLSRGSPGNLYSNGPLPWRLLAYMLDASPEVELIRRLVGKRLMDGHGSRPANAELDRMLMTLWRAGYVTLDPRTAAKTTNLPPFKRPPPAKAKAAKSADFSFGFGRKPGGLAAGAAPVRPDVAPGRRSDLLETCSLFRGIHPLYAVFLVNHLGIADRNERIQAMESVLELPRSMGHFVRVPRQNEMPPGPLATLRLGPAPIATGPGHAGRAFAIGLRRGRTTGARAVSTTRNGCGC